MTARLRSALAFLALLGAALPCAALSTSADELAAQGKLAITLAEARRVESAIGRLLVVNADGFGYSGPLALEPAFVPMLKRLRIGAVIPHYGSTSYERIRRTNAALAGFLDEPLLICADIVKLRDPTAKGGGGRVVSFGDGYVGGFLGRFRRMPDEQLRTLAGLNAFAFAAMGINTALGPTVDTSTADVRTEERARIVVDELRGFRLQTVLKHFPFLPPGGANLHRESPDTDVSPDEAQKRYAIFHSLADEADLMMSTHLFDSAVDDRIATFSPAWISLLRGSTGFTGPLMSDGLLMLKNYADRKALGNAPPGLAGVDEAAAWAARAILAGHDMVIVEGSAAQTVRVFAGLLAVSCGPTATGTALRERILESSTRIARWKEERAAALRRTVDVSPATMARVIALLPADDANLASFAFDPSRLAAIAPAMEAASVRR